jgi:hypothetical protein
MASGAAGRLGGDDGGSAFGEEPASKPPVKEQHALDLLKRMSDRLAGAKAFTFRSRSTIEAPGGMGQFLNFFACQLPHRGGSAAGLRHLTRDR